MLKSDRVEVFDSQTFLSKMDDDTDTLMDDFLDFGPPKRKYIPPKPNIEPQLKKIKVEEVIDYKRESKGTEYATRHQKKEENMLAAQSLNVPSTSKQENIFDDDKKVHVKEDPELPELDVFQRYTFGLNPRELPILKKRKEILENITNNMVTVLTASTGTGKSSQVPQYILEEARKRDKNCNIIVTQPRRIAGEITKIFLVNIRETLSNFSDQYCETSIIRA